MDIAIADCLLTLDDGGEIRINLGDKASGVGFAAKTAIFGADGFLGAPNADDDTGCAQAIQITDGNLRIALCPRDARYDSKAGTLAPGDRAITSNCDARLKLTQAENTIALFATGQGLSLDGADGHTRITNGGASIDMTDSSITISMGGASITLGAASLVLAFGASSIMLDATGVHVMVPPLPFPNPGWTVNATPLQVP